MRPGHLLTSRKLWELEIRENNGTGNNVDNPTWGTVGSQLLRTDTPTLYSDGSQAPRIYPQELGEGLKVEDPNSPYVSASFDPMAWWN